MSTHKREPPKRCSLGSCKVRPAGGPRRTLRIIDVEVIAPTSKASDLAIMKLSKHPLAIEQVPTDTRTAIECRVLE